MIRFKRNYLFILPILMMAVACKKDTVNNAGGAPPNINPNSNNIQFIADGTNYQFSDFVIEDLGEVIYVHREDTANNYFYFKFDENVEPGNYDFGYTTDFEFAYSYNMTNSEYYHSINGSGSITINSNDTEKRLIKGTYQCPVARTTPPYDIKQITAGSFKINY